ncbi:hypothetical protein C0995_008139 [Termitomyces sp. Mi166|nr:hypothetical protein C0995_008139 [Termitomyces sp. Mi166\
MPATSIDTFAPASEITSTQKPFSKRFFDKNNAVQRGIYFKVLFGGVFSVILVIFTIFPIFWGALWKIPVRNLDGWVVCFPFADEHFLEDFDGGFIGQTVVEALTAEQMGSLDKITWTAIPPDQFPDGLDQLANAVREEKTWAAIAIHAGSTARLQASYMTPNASYDGSEAITIYGDEARNENA